MKQLSYRVATLFSAGEYAFYFRTISKLYLCSGGIGDQLGYEVARHLFFLH